MCKDKMIEHHDIPSSLKINPTPQSLVEPCQIEEMEKEKFLPMSMANTVVVLKTFNYEQKKKKISRRVSKKDKIGRLIVSEQVFIHETKNYQEMTAVSHITMTQATCDIVLKLKRKVYDAHFELNVSKKIITKLKFHHHDELNSFK